MLRWLAMFVFAVPLAAEDPVHPRLHSGQFGEVKVELLLPDSPKIRGLLVHAANTSMKTEDRWSALGQELGFGHAVLTLNGKANNRPKKLGEALESALKEWGKTLNRPELPNVPWVGIGHSAGGMVVAASNPRFDHVITHCVDCGWVTDMAKLPEGREAVPMLFSMGAVPDGFKMLPSIDEHFYPARKAGLAWGLGVQHGCAHDFANAASLMVPWVKGCVAARLNPNGGPLKPVKLENGWLGDSKQIDGHWATIAPYAEYKGDKEAAAWFPSEASAKVWRAWQTKKSPWILEARSEDGSAKMPEYNIKKSRDMNTKLGQAIVLGVSGKGAAGTVQMEYFSGKDSLGKATAAPWEVTWKEAPAGVHPVYSVWTDAQGKTGAVNPYLVVVRK